MKEHKYTTTFSSTVKPLISEEKDKYLALASLEKVGDFVPDVDTDKNVDLLPVAFNAFVANRVNKNGDVISGETAISIAESFVNKPINIEHNRDRVIGVILTAGYSEFGTDRSLTEEQVKNLNGPFNITLGGVIWKVVNNSLADLIEEASDPTSEDYLTISASWELGFSDYNLAVIDGSDKNLENAEIISNDEEIEALEGNLKANGGEGTLEDGRAVYRYVVGNVVPLGIGLTESPAAEVEGVATKKTVILAENENNNNIEKQGDLLENNSSQNNEINVKKNKLMKIEKVSDITEESLKTLSASAVSDFIEEEIQRASDEYTAKMTEKDEAFSELKDQNDSLKADHEKMSEELDSVKSDLAKLDQERQEREALEQFNNRMSAMDEEYELNDEDRKVIASDVKDLDEEAFTAYRDKMSVLLRDKNKSVIAEEQAKAEEVAEKEVEEQPEATTEASEEVAEEVLDSVEEDSEDIPTTSEAAEKSLYEKYQAAFGLDQFDISK